jgi:hypothetical protein
MVFFFSQHPLIKLVDFVHEMMKRKGYVGEARSKDNASKCSRMLHIARSGVSVTRYHVVGYPYKIYSSTARAKI